jgi:hypothetical protein
MRVRAGLTVLLCLILAGCARPQARELARYYDPQGLFSAELPAANTVSVTAAQQGQGSSSVVTGVVSSPPRPSASPSSALGAPLGGMAAQAPAGDQTLYQVLVVTTDSFPSVDAMALHFLTADPAIDVREERSITVGDDAGRLVVADVLRSGAPGAGLAAAFSLGTDGVGYIVAAVFPPGDWPQEEADFSRVVGSLDPGVPPGLTSFPLTTA